MKKILNKLSLLSCISIVVVGGCQTTGGGSPSTSYEAFNSTAQKTSTLSGVVQQSNGTTGAKKLLSVSGSLTHNTDGTTVDDGSYKLVDSDGADSKMVISDGTSTLQYKGNFTGDYKYARTFQQSYAVDGVSYDTTGIIGIATRAENMPKSSVATYTGEAEAVVIIENAGFDLKSGTSSVSADFGTGKVSVTLNGFTGADLQQNQNGTIPIDEIKITDMTISGNGFSGGTVTTLKSGNVVDVIGSNVSQTSQGSFFALNEDGAAPAEVGGLVLMQGDTGLISGTYLAK